MRYASCSGERGASMRVLVLAAVAACLASCGSGDETDFIADYAREQTAESVTQAKAAAARDLRDPSSAQFRDLRSGEYDGQGVICGEINGKNAYGAYAGFTGFVAHESMIGEVTSFTANDGRTVEGAMPCVAAWAELVPPGAEMTREDSIEIDRRGCAPKDFDLMFWNAQYDLYCKTTTPLPEGT